MQQKIESQIERLELAMKLEASPIGDGVDLVATGQSDDPNSRHQEG